MALQRQQSDYGRAHRLCLKTGAWIDYGQLSLRALSTSLTNKGLSFKEAKWERAGRSWKRDVSLTAISQNKRNFKKSWKTRWKAQTFWQNGKTYPRNTRRTFANTETSKYKGQLPQDLRYLPFCKDKDSVYPCLMVAARSPEITAVQLTFLDPHTASKATLETPKVLWTPLKDLLQETLSPEGKPSHPLFIAEGTETALWHQRRPFKGTIKASLGLSNIGRR